MKRNIKKILSVILTLVVVAQMFIGMGNVAQAADATAVTISGIASNSGTTAVDGGVQYGIYLLTNYSNTGATWGGWDNSTTVIVNGVETVPDGTCWASDVLLYIQITLPTATPLESVQIDAGKQFTINSTPIQIQNTYTVYYYDGGYHDTAKVSGEPVTIQGIASNSGTTTSGDNIVYGIYLQTNYNNTGATWGGWDNATTVIVNGEERVPDGTCWASDVLLYIQITLSASTPLESVQIDAGKQFTINSTVLEIQNTYTVYYYDGGYHDTANVTGTPITINALDSRSTYGNGLYQLYVTTNTTGITATWGDGGWDNTTTVTINGELQRVANACWAADGLLYIQPGLETDETLESITIPQGTQFTMGSNVYEITADYTAYYYDDAWHSEAKVVGTPITINALDSRSTYGNGLYQLYVTTNATGITATWGDGGWDNTTTVTINGELQRVGNVCWAADGLLYVQPALEAGEVLESITISQGTQFTMKDKVYDITADFTVYYYDDAWHSEPKAVVTPITINAIDSRSTASELWLSTESLGIDWSWEHWDNSTQVTINGDTSVAANACWVVDTVFYMAPTVPEGMTLESISVSAGTQFTINGNIYEIPNDYVAYYYDEAWHNEPKPVITPITINAIDSRSTASELWLSTESLGIDWSWQHWDNSTQVTINGDTSVAANACWVVDTVFYMAPTVPEGMTLESISVSAGTQFTINGNIYEIPNDYVAYYYDGVWHNEAKEYGEPVTITGINQGETATRFENGNYMLYLQTNIATTQGWADGGWDNAALVYVNGTEPCVANMIWSSNTGELYMQPAITSAVSTVETFLIKAGTQFRLLGTLYEITDDYTVYFKNNVFADAPLYTITKTIGDTTVVETVSGDYTLPEIPSKEEYLALGWDVNGQLYRVGNTRPANDAGYTIKAVYAKFSQVDGAQVRLTAANEEEKVGGIRFISKLGADSKSEYIIQIGMLIIPTDYMTNGELTHANYELQKDDWSNEGFREFVVNNEEMVLEVYEQDTAANGAENYYLKGSIVNLYEYNYTRKYSARSFLKVQYADGEGYIYTEYDPENNERRICDIAKKMLETYPDKYSPLNDTKYPIVYEYAKVADTMESFAFFGPEVVVTDDVYNVAETKSGMQEYAAAGFNYLWLDSIDYHYHDRYSASTVEAEMASYVNPGHPSFDLKQTMKLADECGLDVIVLDWAIRQLSLSDIPLVNTDVTTRQAIGVWLQTGDGVTAELIGSAIDESKFNADFTTYTYDGASVDGYASGQAKVLNYVFQFASEEELKQFVAIKMSAYAQEENFRGVMLSDEPKQATFAQLAMMTKVIKSLYPNAYVQNSNLPCYGYQSGSGTLWDEYDDGYAEWSAEDGAWNQLLQAHADVNSGVTETGINFYPYVRWYHNPIIGSDYYTYELRDHYLSSLQHLATTTKDTNIGLEFTIQSYAVENLYANISASKLNLQANLALAFGVKTLGYFRYTGAGTIEPGSDNWEITQSITSDTNLKNAVLYNNKNGNYLKAHMTFFKYEGTKVYGTGSYVPTTDLEQLDILNEDIITVPSGATVLVNEFYNEYTDQFGYYVVNLATLNDNSGNDKSNSAITITLSDNYYVYQDYKNYSSERANKVNTVTLADGQGAFIVVG